ncbi:MAG: type I 3-dehydroquinate dehydratase [Acidobacteriota bacterium]|nr:type I 3-dehydroquinate dehydratase [Acidobacteriota bacterium]
MAARQDGVGNGRDSVLLVATLTSEPTSAELSSLSTQADVLEVRADLVGDLEPDRLRRDFSGELLYTLRSEPEGDVGDASKSGERHARLAAAAAGFDLVDLEAARDLEPAVLESVPPAQRLISWHGPPTELGELRSRFDSMQTERARYYKLVPAAERPVHGLVPLALLASLGRDDVLAFSTGPSGFWTRLLAPRLGAPVVFGSAGEQPAAPAQPSIGRLRRDYGLPLLGPVEAVFGLVGNPALSSLSPRLHNASYAELGIPSLYLPFEVEAFGDFWLDVVERGSLGVLGFGLAGLSVTAPFKEIALAVAGAGSPLADRLGSANSLVRRGQVWEAESTDGEGVLGPLAEREISVEGREAAVVGSGGAGAAAAQALDSLGARVTLVNRSVARGRRTAHGLGIGFSSLADFDPSVFELLVNATPLGREDGGELPFDIDSIREDAVVVDLAYCADRRTHLVEELAGRGVTVVDGREVLLHQAVRQFQVMTGQELPVGLGRRVLGLEGGPVAGFEEGPAASLDGDPA